jgi:hypothetical protein
MRIKLKEGMFFHWCPQSIASSVVGSSALINILKRNVSNESLIQHLNPVLIYVPIFSIFIQLLFSVKNDRGQIHSVSYEWVLKIMVLSMVLASLQIVNSINESEAQSAKRMGA